MNNFFKRTWAEINFNALDNNLKVVENFVGKDVAIMAVVKANAYGHGAKNVALFLQSRGINNFGVATFDEAVELRQCGVKGNILILGYTPVEAAEQLMKYDITQTVFSLTYAKKLNDALKVIGQPLKCHIKVDTGMSRIGYSCQNDEEISKSVEEIKQSVDLEYLEPVGIFTHFAVSEVLDSDFTQVQFDRFIKVIDILEKDNYNLGIKHCCNSGGVLYHKDKHLDMVRPGIILYGVEPDGRTDTNSGLIPVMTLKSSVEHVKKGSDCGTICYGRTAKAYNDRVYATISIGYGDGYPTTMSNIGEVLIHGKRAKICGRVCMDQMVVDVTHIPDVKMGDEVIIFGTDGNERIYVEELAKIQDKINYEILCEINNRVTRVKV